MRGRAGCGYRRSSKVAALEAEYGLPFPQIIAGFVADGCNKSFVAGVLEFDRANFYRKLKGLERAGVTFDWPDPYTTRDVPPDRNTPAQQAARQAALEKARDGSRRYWETRRKGTPELVQQATALHAQGLSWRVVAHRLGVDPTTLHRARKNNPKLHT